MLAPALILDGLDVTERAECALVAALLRRTRKLQSVTHVELRCAAELPPRLFTQRWSIVWLRSHVTHYRKRTPIASIERRDGCVFRQLLRHEDLARIDARVLVLSGCYTADSILGEQEYAADIVLAHSGKLFHTPALLFAGAFVSVLTARMRRDYLPADMVRYAFDHAHRLLRVPEDRWRFLKGA